MSTNKHIDKICTAAVAVMLVITVLFMYGGSLGIRASAQTMKYEKTLFDTSYVHRIDIVMNDWDSFISTCENEEYSSCTVVVDGQKHANVAIRAKGNTSLSSVRSMGSQRYSFKLEFDHYEDAKSLDGLDKLCLNNLIQDNTMMKDYLAYRLMDDFGADSPLCSFAYLTVNGEDWGLYLAVEGIEDSFLARNYGSDTGDLYKPDSMSFGGGRGNGKNFNMDDFDFGDSEAGDFDPGSFSFGGFDPGSFDFSGFDPNDFDFSGFSGRNGSGQQSDGNRNEVPGSPGQKSGRDNTLGLNKGTASYSVTTLSAGSSVGGFGGMTPPDGFSGDFGDMTPPGGFSGDFDDMTPPGGFSGDFGDMTPPDDFSGDFGDMTPPDDFFGDFGDMTPPDDFSGDVAPETDQRDKADNETGDQADQISPDSTGRSDRFPSSGNMPGFQGGGGGFGGFGMGSDDVKLKYIDDDPSSYTNIFGNAKTDVTQADEKRLIASLKNLSEYTDLENVLDTDEVLRYFVVHNFVCNGDSYTGSMIHNYYLHEKDGRLGMIPWDYNLAFGTFQGGNGSSSVNASIDSPVSGDMNDRPMVGWIFSDDSYTEEYHRLFCEFIDKWFTNSELEKMIADTAEMIRPYVEKDPTKFCTLESFDKGVTAIAKFVTLRAEAVSRQLKGDSTAVSTDDLNVSDMGTMGGGMGGGRGGDNVPSMPGGFSSENFDISAVFSMIKLTDKDGNTADASELFGEHGNIVSVTLSDGSEIDFSSAGIASLMQTDLSGIASVTFEDGSTADLTGYTISFSSSGGRDGAVRFNRMTDTGPASQGDSAGEAGRPTQQEDRQKPDNIPSGRPDSGEQGSGRFPGMSGERLGSGRNRSRSDSESWILVGISAAVLAAGLLIAVRKKT